MPVVRKMVYAGRKGNPLRGLSLLIDGLRDDSVGHSPTLLSGVTEMHPRRDWPAYSIFLRFREAAPLGMDGFLRFARIANSEQIAILFQIFDSREIPLFLMFFGGF